MYRVLVQMYLYGPKQYLRNYWADLAEILRAMGALARLTTNQISARYDQFTNSSWDIALDHKGTFGLERGTIGLERQNIFLQSVFEALGPIP